MFPVEAEFFYKILNRFGISPPKDLFPDQIKERDEIVDTCRAAIDKINMNKHMKNDGQEKKRFIDPLVFKDYYLNGLKRKVVNDQIDKAKNVRQNYIQTDMVVITRVVKGDFKCINQGKDLLWKLSKANECFVCDRHKYTLIFVDKKRKNDGFIKIEDEESILKLKRSFRLNKCEHSYP